MTYTTNKELPRVRQEAVRLVKRGWSTRKVGRHLGYHHTAVMKWVKRSGHYGDHPLPTRSSRPKTSPNEIDESIKKRIIDLRLKTRRCAEVIHLMLLEEGIKVCKNTIHRVLDRGGFLKKRSPWKRYHPPTDRPYPEKAGDLVEIDTIHTMQSKKVRMYTFTLIDVYSRQTYAKSYQKMNAATAVHFVEEAQKHSSFTFNMIQSDHGPEFGKWFVERVSKSHRYTRVGKPNDNAHIERFNRTLQEECLDKLIPTPEIFNKALRKYLKYYNTERIHLSIKTTPMQMVPRSW
jgi:putative transposase